MSQIRLVGLQQIQPGGDVSGFQAKTTTEINNIPSPSQGEMVYDSDLEVLKTYSPLVPEDDKWNQIGVSNEGIVKINGSFDNEAPCTFSTGTNLVNNAAHGLINDAKVSFKPETGTLPVAVIVDRPYFVINALTNTFQIAASIGGDAIVFADAGTAGTVYFEWVNNVNLALSLVADVTSYFICPDHTKLTISSATAWPPNAPQTDATFYNNDVLAGTFNGTVTSGSDVITVVNTTVNITAGMKILGTGIPDDTMVFSVTVDTITMTADATATNTLVDLTMKKNKFVENSSNLQKNTFRIRATFTKSSSAAVETVEFNLFNPLSGFLLEHTEVIRKQLTSGNITFDVTSISDSNSIGEGYVFSMIASDDMEITILDTTRFSAQSSRLR